MSATLPRDAVPDAAADTARGPVAFVLQGGGGFSAAQVGMLRALLRHGVLPDMVVGSSAGALNAVAFAADPTLAGLHRLRGIWLSLRRRDVAPISVRNLLGVATGRAQGLVTNAGLRSVIESQLTVRQLTDTVIPAHVVVTDASSGRAVILSDGNAADALIASAALPGLYPPVVIRGTRYIDGGVAADLPIHEAEMLGAAVTFVLPAAVETVPRAARGPVPLAYRALGLLLDGIARRDIAAASGEIHLLPTLTSRATGPIDFRDTSRLMSLGYELTGDWLSQRADTEVRMARRS